MKSWTSEPDSGGTRWAQSSSRFTASPARPKETTGPSSGSSMARKVQACPTGTMVCTSSDGEP